ncbi:uncharacterized protein TRIVIDRAFT_92844 [Trichoderma virens Gv29-8]|uniref:Uncharacterized protein n=1 Tax=Hypocrea virens (strain Gv29-8 / FGSC 10586) TaxID=413071 RepID=G9N0E9_HYPVG|nr:uncharacterized protein TRIVIDRAFT_92844 [Trichoderma virens Gv29-8]EHK19831.1 hypothetical protein TRIVIDRAFT_92844 [Trichoderma virens Gv29-8]
MSVDDFHDVDRLSSVRGQARFLNPIRHLGFDIFDEEYDQTVADSAPWDKYNDADSRSKQSQSSMYLD